MADFFRIPRVVAAINLLGSAGFAAAPFYFHRDPFSQGSFAYVVLKDETKLKIPEAAVEHEVPHSMRALNPCIEKRSETVPLRSRDPAARA